MIIFNLLNNFLNFFFYVCTLYTFTSESRSSTGKLNWKYTEPDYECMALLTIDLQNDFTLKGAICEITGTVEKIPNVLKILNKFRQKNCLIIHIVSLYKKNG